MDSNSYNLARPTHEIASICVCLSIFFTPELYRRWTPPPPELGRTETPVVVRRPFFGNLVALPRAT